jgi:hypothetical protein
MFSLFVVISLMSTCFAASSSDLAHLINEPPSVEITAAELALSTMPINSITKSDSTSTISLQETRLVGYLKLATYSDSGCKTLTGSTNTHLNECGYDLNLKGYASNYATASEVTFRTYSDYECKTLLTIQTYPNSAPSCSFVNGQYGILTIGPTKETLSTNPTVYIK